MIKNEYSKLKKVLVGREFDFPQRTFDISFKVFFQDHLDDLDLVKKFSKEYTAEIVGERNEDLDNLAKVLEEHGVEVYRPEPVTTPKKVKTPYFDSIQRSASNVRDQCFVYKNTIYETSPSLRGRYFENDGFYNVLLGLYKNGYNWIQFPKSRLTDEAIDDADWKAQRDFSKDTKFEPFFDAANLLKVDDKVLFNYSSFNHYLGIEWLKRNIDADLITVRLLDNHIDGALAFLDESTVLVNPKSCLIDPVEAIPFLKDFRVLRLPDETPTEFDTDLPHIASREGMSINVLSIDPKTVVVNSFDTVVAELLDKAGFNVIPVKLRYCTAFGGGIHCSTLDLDRE